MNIHWVLGNPWSSRVWPTKEVQAWMKKCTTVDFGFCHFGVRWAQTCTHSDIHRIIGGVAQIVFLYNLIVSAFNGKKAPGNPWNATSLEWQTETTPPGHGNFGKELPCVYRWAYDYSVPGVEEDFIPQNVPPRNAQAEGAQ